MKLQVLVFSIQSVNMCVDLNSVNKVVPLPQLEVVPGSARSLIGLLNLAGDTVAVFDLGLRLGMLRKNKYALDAAIIIFKSEQTMNAIIVDQILGFAEIDSTSLNTQSLSAKADHPFLAVIEINQKLTLMVDPKFVTTMDLYGPETQFHDEIYQEMAGLNREQNTQA